MNKIDTEKIKEMTNNLIGYEYYEREERMKKNKLKKVAFTFLAFTILIGGTLSVDALTDNSISDTIKNVLKIKVNDNDYNAKCEKMTNGNIKCSLDESVLEGSVFTIETNEENLGKIDVEYKEGEADITIKEEMVPMN